jgi:hypothetical protein
MNDTQSSKFYSRRRQPTACVPSIARGTIFSGTLSEIKCSNFDVTCLICLIVLFFKLLQFLSLQNVHLTVL